MSSPAQPASSSDQPQRDAYRQHLYNTVLVKRSRVRVRNQETRMWSLVAKRGIPAGAFIGFYTGSMASRTCPPGSHYALHVGPSQPCIVPFPDENHISPQERDTHPLASMNEPSQGEYANCHMAVQDFNASEIQDVTVIQHHETARYFRGMACFACQDIPGGEALTWNYGPAYEPIRQQMGYTAGQPCRRVLENEIFIKPDSQSVLDALPRVPAYCVYPVLITQQIKSSRFKVRRRHSTDSEGEMSGSFSSGSDVQQEVYRPRPSRRREGGTS
jgi:hypothetical protein